MIRYRRLRAPECLSKKIGKSGWRSDTPCYRDIRNLLSLANQEHCAFCDGKLGVESRPTVEHFRPTSKFPEQTYDWHNLFPACDGCQSAKHDRFDDALLKPDVEGYEFENYFQINMLSGALEPLENADSAAQNQAQITIDMYQLNKPHRLSARKRELKHWRLTPMEERRLEDFNYRYFLGSN